MWGAIIGDLAGSIYEYGQTKKISNIKIEGDLLTNKCFFSDDTILTIAIADAILSKKDYEEVLKEYANKFLNYKPNFNPYFKKAFSNSFIDWVKGTYQGDSNGNGALMRISAVGYLFDNEEDVINNAYLATKVSHNSDEAIYYATLVSLIIFYARNKMSKDEIIKRLDLNICETPFTSFNTTCLNTIDNCLFSVFNSNSFEESIRKIISYGGDTDTNACIVGSMAEAFYNVSDDLITKASEKIPKDFIKVLKKAIY